MTNTTTTRTLADTDQHDLPLDQSDAANAANAALFEGKRALQEAREAWALVKETFGNVRSLQAIEEATPGEQTARRLAVRLEQRAGKTLGLVSSSACGLWGVDDQGRIFQVEGTSGGSDYLDSVRYVKVANTVSGAITWDRHDEIPVSMVAAFFETYRDAAEFLNPSPARGIFGPRD